MSRPSKVLFIGHGNPMHAVNGSAYMNEWRRLGEQLEKPKAILCLSAHWLEPGAPRILATPFPETIHDFYGFPQILFDQRYPSPGAPHLAADTQRLLHAHGAVLEHGRGIDHGVWSFLLSLFPEADVPVYQMSMDLKRSLRSHYELGKELLQLRERGVMIIGSGNIVHNLRFAQLRGNPPAYDWALEFDALIEEILNSGDDERLWNFGNREGLLHQAHPTVDHYLPLLYVAALRTKSDQMQYFNTGIDAGSVSMRSLIFTS